MFRPTPDLLTALSQRRLGPGLWQTDDLHVSAATVLAGLGWRVIQLDLRADTTKEQLLDALGDAASFPDHYGRNWDAAADCLTELEFAGPLVVIINGAGDWAANNAKDATVLASIIDDTVAWFADLGRVVYGVWQGSAPAGVPSFAQVG